MESTVAFKVTQSVCTLFCDSTTSRGTAFPVSSSVLVTCAHVIENASTNYAISEFLDCDTRAVEVKLMATDPSRDLAILETESPVFKPLPLFEGKCPDDLMPLLIVTWPGWKAFQSHGGAPEPEDLTKCALRPAVVTRRWGRDHGLKCDQFSFAGRAEGGMSGGPVVTALTAEVVGIVTQSWNLNGSEIGETWYEFAAESLGETVLPPEEIVAAQIDLGTGMAVDVGELREFLAESGIACE